MLSALAGTLIGAIASITTVIIQARISDRRARMQLIVTAAMEQYNQQVTLAEKNGRPESILPLVVYLHHHLGIAKLIEADDLRPETFERPRRQHI